MTTANIPLSLTLTHREMCDLFKALSPSGTIGFDAQRAKVAYMRTVLESWAAQQPNLGPQMEAHAKAIIARRAASPATMPIPPAPAAISPAPAPTVLQSIADAMHAHAQDIPQHINPLNMPDVQTGNPSQAQPTPEAPQPAPFRTLAAQVQDEADARALAAEQAAQAHAAAQAQPAPQPMPFSAEAQAIADAQAQEDAQPAPAQAAQPAPQGPTIIVANSQALPALPFGRRYVRDIFADLQQTAPALFNALNPRRSVPAWPLGHFPEAEAPNPSFRWTLRTLRPALIGLGTTPAVPMLFFGGAGTGKTEAARQLAARCGRPFVRINCNRHTEAADIMGDIGLVGNGRTDWVDGPFSNAANKYPEGAAVVLVDEPSYVNAGALACLNPVLERGGAALSLPKGNKVLHVHPEMAVIFADNTALTGDTTGVYHNRHEMGEDIRQRVAFKVKFDYLPKEDERALLQEAILKQTGKKATAAALAPLMKILGVSRQECDAGKLQGAPSFRGAVAFALLVAEGCPVDEAFQDAIVNQAPAEFQHALTEIFRAHVPMDSGAFSQFAFVQE